MPLPTSDTWDLVDFSPETAAELGSLTPGEAIFEPPASTALGYNATEDGFVYATNTDESTSVRFKVPVPSRYTVQLVLRCPALPHNLGDLAKRRFGFAVADDAGYGFAVYFAKTGIAISRVDGYGAATALPDTSDVTAAVATDFFTLRIAVDSGQRRAYVFMGPGVTDTPPLRWIIPVERTPPGFGDRFSIFGRGLAAEPVRVELAQIRLAGDLVLANYPPVADAGADRVAPIGSAVRFDGRASYNVEGTPVQYKWTCIDAPYGSAYTAEVSTAYTADDGDADGVTTAIQVELDQLPSWAGAGDLVKLQGATYTISFVDATTGRIEVTSDGVPDNLEATPLRIIRQSILLDPASPMPTAIADLPGLYRFSLVVNDGEFDSEPSEVLANLTALQTPSGVEPDVAVLWKALGDEWPLIEGRGVFEELWIGVAQILSGKLLEAWQHHYNNSIRDAQKIFQRKWLGYRTLIPETAPDRVEIEARHGGFISTWQFENLPATIQDCTLDLELPGPNGRLNSTTIFFPGVGPYTLNDAAATINQQLAAAGIDTVAAETQAAPEGGPELRFDGTGHTVPVSGAWTVTPNLILDTGAWPPWLGVGDILALAGRWYTVSAVAGPAFTPELPRGLSTQSFALHRAARLALVGTVAFRVDGDAAAVLGFPLQAWNRLCGETGAQVTSHVYYTGVDLAKAGVKRGDLLVINNGESFVIDRVLSDRLDPGPNARALLFDELPLDTSATWAIPSVIRSAEVDYERVGAYPGDYAKTELLETTAGKAVVGNNVVVAQKGTQLAVDLCTVAQMAIVVGTELRFLGVRRRKAVPLFPDTVSVPTLQELIAERLEPVRYHQHVDYVLEPFYRDTGSKPVPMLQFADSVYITPDREPPDVLWAETTLFSNEGAVEDLFGRLVGFLRDDAAGFPKDFNYIAGVAGLLYAQQHGPSLFAMAVGAQILLGQPFAEVPGYIEEIRPNYSPQQGRILIRDDDGKVPTESETVRAYYYKRNPEDTDELTGLDVNPSTGKRWLTGEHVPQFSSLGAGIVLDDAYTKPKWWSEYIGTGALFEIEKFHRFVCTFDLSLVDIANVGLLSSMLTRIKPTYTKMLFLGAKNSDDDLDVVDSPSRAAYLWPYDTMFGSNGERYDDYRGDGIIGCLYDDGATRFDADVDSIVDLIGFDMTINWPGGILQLPSMTWPFALGAHVIDVDGAETGVPGATVTLVSGMDLAAGTYEQTVMIKDGPVLPPL